MSYLYKILADELQAPAWLAKAPMHIYIKCRNKQQGFYNTELTTGQFPSDASIASSGYISTEAIVSGLYMDTLSKQQNIASCLLDLATALRRKHPKQDSLYLCYVKQSLHHYPNNVNALLKLTYLFRNRYAKNKATSDKEELEKYLSSMLSLGYTEIPPKIYAEWLRNISNKNFAENEKKYTFDHK